MSLEDFEVAPEFQALSGRACRDGRFVNAHVLRALTRSVNQAVLEGEPLLSLSWDSRRSSNPEVDEKAVRAVCSPYWTRMLPGVHLCPKMPGLSKATFIINAEITAGARVWLQIETYNSNLDLVSDHPSGRVFELIGTGTEERYTLEDVPISPGAYERIGFWIRGERTDTVGDGDDHGITGSERGRIIQVDTEGNLLADTSWNFDPSEDKWAIDHAIVVHDGPDENTIGRTLFSAQFIEVISGSVSSHAKVFRPPSDNFVANSLRQKFFVIYELPKIRLFAIDAFTQDATDGVGMQPVRKIHHHPRAPHVGVVLGNNLRNVQSIQAYRGRSIVHKNWSRNLERPFLSGLFWDSDELLEAIDPETFFLWHYDVRRAPGTTDAGPRRRTNAHVCFTVLSDLATRVRLFIAVSDGTLTETSTVDIALGSDADARITEGALSPFEARGGSYESIVSVPAFEGIGPRTVRLAACALHDDTSAPPDPVADAMKIDAVSIWMEMR